MVSGVSKPATIGLRERSGAHTREAVKAAAVTLFSEFGFDGTAIREIAERSGVKQSLILYHFENKQNLWYAAVDDVWGRMEETLVAFAVEHGAAPPEPGAPLRIGDREELRTWLRAFIQSVAEHPEYLRILLREASHPGPRFDWLVAHHTERNYQMGAALFASAQEQGLLPDIPVHHLVYLLAGALTFVFAVEADVERQTGFAPSSPQFLDRHVDALLGLLIRAD